ncbi:MAG: hypothetical protein ACRDS0_24805, partial [Pseudonocardiaceae bacterium]
MASTAVTALFGGDSISPDPPPYWGSERMIGTVSTGCLAPAVERLLLDVLTDGFTVFCCGPKAAPTALVARYDWPDCIDLI